MFAISYVENLIKENYRMRSVMLKSLVEIDQNLKSHLSGDEKIDMELFRLLDNLCFRRRDEYNLDRDSFLKDIRAKLDFDNFEK